MFHNTAILPPKSIYNCANAGGLVIKPALVAFELGTKDSDLRPWPNWTKKVQGSIRSVLGERVVILCQESQLKGIEGKVLTGLSTM